MSSPCNVKIINSTHQSITTKKIYDHWVEDDGKTINNIVIPEGDERTSKVVAKTGHHGELTIDFIGGATGQNLATLKIKSIKDPQEGEKSLEVESKQDDIVISAMGYRHSPGIADMRRIDVVLVQK